MVWRNINAVIEGKLYLGTYVFPALLPHDSSSLMEHSYVYYSGSTLPFLLGRWPIDVSRTSSQLAPSPSRRTTRLLASATSAFASRMWTTLTCSFTFPLPAASYTRLSVRVVWSSCTVFKACLAALPLLRLTVRTTAVHSAYCN